MAKARNQLIVILVFWMIAAALNGFIAIEASIKAERMVKGLNWLYFSYTTIGVLFLIRSIRKLKDTSDPLRDFEF